MIRIQRGAPPPVLLKHGANWREELAAEKDPARRKKLLQRYRHRRIRTALQRDFHDKCAYCESKLSHVGYGHIEHFRPKAGDRGRPDLAFEWRNLLLACGRCNGAENKGDRFPEANEGGPIINPCEEEPADHFRFHFDPKAKIASVYGTSVRGRTTENPLGLNRPELRSYRSSVVAKLAALAQFAPDDPQAVQLLAEAKQDDEYAAFARSLQACYLDP